jgi:protein-S-isoprenylcysteine O-methyltransferase Ste14
MYVGVLLILVGWSIAFRSTSHLAYAALVLVAFHLRVVLAEEPWLARTFPAAWQAYSASVPRWVGLGVWGRSGPANDSLPGGGHHHA